MSHIPRRQWCHLPRDGGTWIAEPGPLNQFRVCQSPHTVVGTVNNNCSDIRFISRRRNLVRRSKFPVYGLLQQIVNDQPHCHQFHCDMGHRFVLPVPGFTSPEYRPGWPCNIPRLTLYYMQGPNEFCNVIFDATLYQPTVVYVYVNKDGIMMINVFAKIGLPKQ